MIHDHIQDSSPLSDDGGEFLPDLLRPVANRDQPSDSPGPIQGVSLGGSPDRNSLTPQDRHVLNDGLAADAELLRQFAPAQSPLALTKQLLNGMQSFLPDHMTPSSYASSRY
jgi:hypothetical protein